ncbi:hypothetical protein SF123566_8340 [Shigella flexneri 1235-66]|nr:hypothetical protein SF123566_8340 [Shigella flexneri 1235-66]
MFFIFKNEVDYSTSFFICIKTVNAFCLKIKNNNYFLCLLSNYYERFLKV